MSRENSPAMDTSPELSDREDVSNMGNEMEKSDPSDNQSARSSFQTGILIFALCSATFLAALDITIITTSLPTISNHFHSSAAYVWVGAAYMLADGASTPIWSKVSDIWGRKPILLIAVVAFFIGSTLCATAVSMTMLIVGRAIQGFGGGGLLSLSTIVISDMFSLRERGKYYGFIGMTWAIANSLGPLIGGALSERVSWRWCFYINLPCTALVFVIIAVFLKIQTPKTPLVAGLKALDWFGSLTIVGGTVMLLLGLNFGGVQFAWTSITVICLIVFGIVSYALFLIIEYRVAESPIIPFGIFNTRATAAPLLACLFHGFVLVISSYYLPLYFQSVLGATPLLSGVYILALTAPMGMAAAVSGGVIAATGKYLFFIRGGFVLITVASGLFIAFPHGHEWARIFTFQIFLGLGIGPNFQALLVALQNNVHASNEATAVATFGFARNLATSIGVVTGGVVFQNVIHKKYDTLALSLGPSLAGKICNGDAESTIYTINRLPLALKTLARDAFYDSLRDVWILMTAFAAAGLLFAVLIKEKDLSKEHEVVQTGLETEKKRAELNQQNRTRNKLEENGNAA